MWENELAITMPPDVVVVRAAHDRPGSCAARFVSKQLNHITFALFAPNEISIAALFVCCLFARCASRLSIWRGEAMGLGAGQNLTSLAPAIVPRKFCVNPATQDAPCSAKSRRLRFERVEAL